MVCDVGCEKCDNQLRITHFQSSVMLNAMKHPSNLCTSRFLTCIRNDMAICYLHPQKSHDDM